MMQALVTVIVIHAGGLLADPGDASLREQTVVVTDGKITSVEKGYQPPSATAPKRGSSTSKIASCCPV